MNVSADTNVILRRLHRAHPQHREACDAIKQAREDGDCICVTSQNLIECWVICTRPVPNNGLGLSPNQADRIIESVERSVFRLPDSDDVYPVWRQLVSTYGVSEKKAHDARIVAAMTVNAVTTIMTFNVEDFTRFISINIINPARRIE